MFFNAVKMAQQSRPQASTSAMKSQRAVSSEKIVPVPRARVRR
jgi:hypothetical protein